MSYKDKLKRNISLYYIGLFFGELLFIVPIWVSYESGFLTFTQMSLLASSRYALTLLLELPTGAFADLLGRKISMSLGQAINAFGLFLIAFGASTPALVVGVLIRAIGDSLISGSNAALLYDSLKEIDREKDFPKVKARETLVIQASIIISSILGGYLFSLWKGLPYAAYGLSCLVSAVIYFFMTEPVLDTVKFSFKNYIDQNKKGFKELFKNKYVKNCLGSDRCRTVDSF